MIVPVAALDHARQQVLVEHERRDHVRLEVLLEQLDRRVEEAVHVAGADVARVVHDHVDASPPLEHGRRRGAERRAVVEVGGHHERVAARGADQVGGAREAAGER